jgi:ABC-2 type transport system ATP-binding protein
MIDSDALTKRYDGRSVLQDVSFRCEPGTVTGFLGPNGAGKTTTLRVLCGLSEPDTGRATVLGGAYRDLPNPARRVGVLLDASAQHPGRRGREVLAVSAQTIGVPERRVDDLLGLVGLDRAAARKRVRQYSLGMRQRLGLAHALLGDPEVLILDEPANGLDPEGMRWMRGLLRDFADRGGTVLLSSHLLGEVQAIADRIVIIGAGGSSPRAPATSCWPARARSCPRPTTRGSRARCAAPASTPARRDGGLRRRRDPEAVGRAALDGGVALTHLGPPRARASSHCSST